MDDIIYVCPECGARQSLRGRTFNAETLMQHRRDPIQHLALFRLNGGEIRCGWDTLQGIIHEILGPEVTAIEFFPAEDAIVDEVNRRHFWVYPDLYLPMRSQHG